MDLTEPVTPTEKTKRKIKRKLVRLEEDYQKKLRAYKKQGILDAEAQL